MNSKQSSSLKDITTQSAIVVLLAFFGVNSMQHIAVTKDLHPLAKKLNIKYRALGKYQMAVKIAEGLITQGYVDVQSSDGKVNFIRLKRQNIVVKKQFECVDSTVNKNQSKPDDDIGGDTDSVATTDSSSNSHGD